MPLGSHGIRLMKTADGRGGNSHTSLNSTLSQEAVASLSNQQRPIYVSDYIFLPRLSRTRKHHSNNFFQVTWIKQPDYNILTSGKKTFIRDKRFQALDGGRVGDWTLQVKSVEYSDRGMYECQVRTISFKYKIYELKQDN